VAITFGSVVYFYFAIAIVIAIAIFLTADYTD